MTCHVFCDWRSHLPAGCLCAHPPGVLETKENALEDEKSNSMATCSPPCLCDAPTTKPKASRHVPWAEKLLLADVVVVRDFVRDAVCVGECTCADKVRTLGEAGVKMVVDLRDARFQGEFCTRTHRGYFRENDDITQQPRKNSQHSPWVH